MTEFLSACQLERTLNELAAYEDFAALLLLLRSAQYEKFELGVVQILEKLLGVKSAVFVDLTDWFQCRETALVNSSLEL